MNPLTFTAVADRPSIALSESLRIVLSIEGTAPLRVAVPRTEAVLDSGSAKIWKVRPEGNARIDALPSGRERWVQTYQLDPYQPGIEVPLQFARFPVLAGTATVPTNVEWQALTIRVTTNLTADPNAVRPITGIEELPAPQPRTESSTPSLVIGLVLALTLLGVIICCRIRRKRPMPRSPLELAEAELLAIERSDSDAVTQSTRLANAIRAFVEAHWHIPAKTLTTSELLAACSAVTPLRDLLESCDLVKFSGMPVKDANINAKLHTARDWVRAQC